MKVTERDLIARQAERDEAFAQYMRERLAAAKIDTPDEEMWALEMSWGRKYVALAVAVVAATWALSVLFPWGFA